MELVMPMPEMSQSLVTAADLARMPDDDFSYELVEGRLVRMSKPGILHGVCSERLCRAIAEHVARHGLGVVVPQDTGFALRRNPDTVRAPDVGFIRRERIGAVGLPEGFWPGAPDLVVEVMSPGDSQVLVDAKAEEWLTNGAQVVWVVDVRRRTVSVHRPGDARRTLAGAQALDGEDVLPGFCFPLTALFGGLRFA